MEISTSNPTVASWVRQGRNGYRFSFDDTIIQATRVELAPGNYTLTGYAELRFFNDRSDTQDITTTYNAWMDSTPIPEPTTTILVLLGISALGVAYR